jgi:hypothetical protein
MITRGAKKVGRFAVQFEVANQGDIVLAERGLLAADYGNRRFWSDATRFA